MTTWGDQVAVVTGGARGIGEQRRDFWRNAVQPYA
jgi:hypothetical protein